VTRRILLVTVLNSERIPPFTASSERKRSDGHRKPKVCSTGVNRVIRLRNPLFDRIYQYLAYKGEIRGVEVLKKNEWDTSKTCSACGDDTKSNRVERGLYVCSSCDLVGNADCNGAENMRKKITPSPHGEDRSNGCVVVREMESLVITKIFDFRTTQPSTYLFDRESGTFRTREQVVS